MKKLLFTLIIAFIGINLQAQILKPVKWAYAAKKTSSTEATIYLKATIDPNWHIYSQNMAEGGPVKTSFTFTPGNFTLLGKTLEPTPITKFEESFDMKVSYFENSVIFQQKVKIKTAQTIVKGSIEYMVCNDKQCLPPDEVAFTVTIK